MFAKKGKKMPKKAGYAEVRVLVMKNRDFIISELKTTRPLKSIYEEIKQKLNLEFSYDSFLYQTNKIITNGIGIKKYIEIELSKIQSKKVQLNSDNNTSFKGFDEIELKDIF